MATIANAGPVPVGTERTLLRRVADALDRLLPQPPLDRDAELPPEWFKYPPI